MSNTHIDSASQQRQEKFLLAVYIGAALLAGGLISAFALKGVAAFDLESKVQNIELIVRVLGVVLGIAVFVGLRRNNSVNSYLESVAIEFLEKVTWPTWKETWVTALVSIVFVVIVGLILSIFDWVFAGLVTGLIQFLQRTLS